MIFNAEEKHFQVLESYSNEICRQIVHRKLNNDSACSLIDPAISFQLQDLRYRISLRCQVSR